MNIYIVEKKVLIRSVLKGDGACNTQNEKRFSGEQGKKKK